MRGIGFAFEKSLLDFFREEIALRFPPQGCFAAACSGSGAHTRSVRSVFLTAQKDFFVQSAVTWVAMKGWYYRVSLQFFLLLVQKKFRFLLREKDDSAKIVPSIL